MVAGSVENLVVCRPAEIPVAPCLSGAPVVISAYVVAPASRPDLEAVGVPVDYTQSALFWLLAFGAVVSIWATAQLFRAVRRVAH